MTSPMVSVITPAYNSAGLIGQTIRSVRDQTYDRWEMIVVDDASTDHTAEVVARHAAEDPRIILITQTRNAGPPAARNRGLAEARSRYVAFLDHDDLWLPDKLRRQLEFMQRTGAALSYTGYGRMSEDGARCGGQIKVPPRLGYRQYLRNTAIAMLTTMVDRERTGEVRFRDVPYDDFVMWLSLLKRGHIARGLQEDLARFRVVRGSLSSDKRRAAAWVWRTYRDIEGLSLLDSAWCLAGYALRAAVKRQFR